MAIVGMLAFRLEAIGKPATSRSILSTFMGRTLVHLAMPNPSIVFIVWNAGNVILLNWFI